MLLEFVRLVERCGRRPGKGQVQARTRRRNPRRFDLRFGETAMFPIQRVPGNVPTRSWGTAYRDLVWALGMSDDFTLDFEGQAARAFANLDEVLAAAGADRTRLLSVQVYLHDVNACKPAFDEMWAAWIGDDPQHWPMRSCVQVAFAGGNKIELLAVAARREAAAPTA